MVNLVMQCMDFDEILQRHPQYTTHQSQVAPLSTMLKINVDGNTRHDNACAAAICRDFQGRVTLIATVQVRQIGTEARRGKCNPSRIEAAADMRDTSYIIVSDAKRLVRWIEIMTQCLHG